MNQFRTLICTLLLLSGSLTADNTPAVLDGIKVDFELMDRDGRVVQYDQFRGKNVLLAFGFTHCMHVCPLIATNMGNTLKIATKDAVGIFVSVDTERDTPAITDDYAKKYGENMLGLSGNFQQISATVKNFSATYVVTKSEDNYTVQHTPSIYLIGPDSKVIEVFAMNASPKTIAASMR